MATSEEERDDQVTPQRSTAKQKDPKDTVRKQIGTTVSGANSAADQGSSAVAVHQGIDTKFLVAQASEEDSIDDQDGKQEEIPVSSFLTQALEEDGDEKKEGCNNGPTEDNENSVDDLHLRDEVAAPKHQETEEKIAMRESQPESKLQDDYFLTNTNLQNLIPSYKQFEDVEESSEDDEREFGYADYGGEDESEDESEEEEKEINDTTPGATILEKRQRNMQRNQEKLLSLGLANEEEELDDNQKTPTPRKPPTPRPRHVPLRGMLFATPHNSNQYEQIPDDDEDDYDEALLMERVQEAYPCREAQIQQLCSLLSPALPPPSGSTSCPSTGHVPTPILVTGVAGTGKTSIVRDLVAGLKRLQQPSQARVGSAYINCATLDSFGDLLHEAFRQLNSDMKAGRHYLSPRKSSRTRKRKVGKKNPALLPNFDLAKRRCLQQQQEKITMPQCKTADQPSNNKDKATGPANQQMAEPNENDDNNPIQVEAKAKETFEPRRSQRVSRLTMEAEGPANDNKKVKSELSADLKATASPTGDLASSSATVSRSAQVAAASFGQELKESVFKHPHDAAVLILDNAERLLSVSAAKTNFLAQLLLLPRDKGLNLTIVVITRSIVLEHSRFNNLVPVDKSVATLLGSFQPMRVHFQAYKGKESFRQILAQKTLLKRVVGPSMLHAYSTATENDKFAKRVVDSFINVLVQSLYGICRDLKEMVRLGRRLWPLYVLPLHSSRIENTMKSVHRMFPSSEKATTTESAWKHVLSFLDQQILPQIRQKLDQCMYSLRDQVQNHEVASSSVSTNGSAQSNSGWGGLESLPYLTKCLLLAAFICQTNRADKDKQLFTIQKNGKKNNGNKRKSPGEDTAFGGTKNGTSKVYRPRMFPMERMLSVFVSIVGLNQHQSNARGGETDNMEIDPGTLGSSGFFESLANLRDTGVLHDKANLKIQSGEVLNLSAPRFWCSLTRDEADAIAKNVNFRLENYLF